MTGRLGYDSPNRAWEVFKYHDDWYSDKPWAVWHPDLYDLTERPPNFETWQDAMDYVNEWIDDVPQLRPACAALKRDDS